jgi:hypothetical protein
MSLFSNFSTGMALRRNEVSVENVPNANSMQSSVRRDVREGITEKPVMAEIVDLKLTKSVDNLQLTQVVVTRDRSVPDEQHIKGLKEFARRTIKRFSRTLEKEKLTR